MRLILLDPRHQRLYLYAGGAICFVCIMVMTLINRTANAQLLELGGVSLSTITLSGILTSIVLFVCIMLVFIDWRRGYLMAAVFLGFMLATCFVQTFILSNLGALPGIFTGILSQIALRIIRNHVRQGEQLTITNAVTSASNMRGLLRELEQRFFAGKSGWLLNLHLDRFRALNDSMGYTYGNAALRLVDDRLRPLLPPGGFLANITGAELGIVLPLDVDPEEWAAKAAEELEKKLVLNVEGHQLEHYLSVYAGIASFPEDATEPQELIKATGVTLSYVRRRGHGKVLRFSQQIANAIYREAELESLIKQALAEDWFYMVYQPQFVIHDHRLRGFESLLRLRLPDGSMVSPGEFIPVAENSQLIFDIEDFTLRRAMSQFRAASRLRDFILSVNVSAKSMANPQFPSRIGRILQEMDFPAGRLELEITEYSFAQSQEQTIRNIKALHELGVLVALDDFGTGYTSLEQLLKLPVNLLKIDKSLIDNICNSRQNLDFVKAIIYMGHLMECEVISEGVEDTDQLELLREQECDFVQGYVWGKPMEFDQAERLLGVKA